MSWPTIPLPDAFWFQEGPGLRNWQFTTEGVKILNVGNIMPDGSIDLSRTDRHLSEEEFESKYSHFSVDEGDLVIASSGISFDSDGYLRTKIGFIEVEHLPLCMNTSTIRFKATEGVSCLRYLKHWFQSNEFRQQVSQRVTGSAQLNFGPSHLKTMTITLPPLEEQKRIARILDQADALRRLRTRALDKLGTLGQAIFHEMFGDWRVEPRNWPLVELGGQLDFLTSGSRGWAKYYSEQGAKFIRIQNVKRDAFDMADMAYVSPPVSAEAKRTKVRAGDVLMSITADLGRTAVVPDGIGDAHINQHLAILRLKEMHPRFVSAALSSRAGQAEILKKNREGVKAGLNFEDVRSVLLPSPPMEIQLRFCDRLDMLTNTVTNSTGALKKKESLFASLQHRAFRGEL
ncbi:restriction endonuclease subunit S [Pararhodobacter oceanensis]|uniref:restriction endonuclease subunit S n=1 Tax=Pararhodobacter oceanensis TaxID=2172121 RepID=UPI003A8F6FB6